MPALMFDSITAYEKGRDLVKLIDQDVRDRQVSLDIKERIRNLYYGLNKRIKRFPGQSDIHLHVMAEKIEAFVTKEMNAFWAADPHAHATRVPAEFDEKETAAVERMVNYGIDTDIPGLHQTFECWLRNRHLDSVSVVKPWYNYEERHTVLVEEASTMWEAGDIDLVGEQVPEDRPKLPIEVLTTIFPQLTVNRVWRGGTEVDPLQEQDLAGLEFDIDFVENHVEYLNIHVVLQRSRYVDRIDVYTYRPYPVKDNVEVDLIEFEDLILPYRTKDIQTAPRVAHKYWLTIPQIRSKIDFEDWMIDEDEMSLLVSRARAVVGTDETDEGTDNLKEQKDVVTGQQDTQTASSAMEAYTDDKVLILECYVCDDLDGDGVSEELIYQIPYGLKKIVKAQYLEELFPHGRRPFAVIHSIPISNSFYGWSLGQLLAPINVEVDTIINSVNDAQELINNPFFFYVPTAMPGDPKIFESIQPGQGIPIGDPNGVIFPQFSQQPLANLSTMDSLLLFADRLTISPQAVGSSQVRNAPRTARGTLALLSESGAVVDKFITAAQKSGWAELIYQIYALYESFASDEKWEAVTGHKRTKRSKPIDLHNRIKFVFKGNSVNTNREVMRSIAQVRYNTLAANPLYAADPTAYRALTEDFLRHFSEGANIEKLLPRLPAQGGNRQPISQEQETEIIIQGVPLDVLPADDDAEHLRSLERERRSQRFENLTQDKVALLAFHASQHQRQLLMKQQQSQLEPGGTQGNNVPQGITQDLNSLEGGIV